MPFQPINYGNILAQNEQIRGQQTQNALAQRAFDPNSMQNRLGEAQILKLQREAAGGGVDPTSNMRDIEFLQRMRESGKYSKEDIALMEDAISKRWYGKIGQVPSWANAGGSGSLGGATIEGEGNAAGYIKNAEQLATQAAQGGTRYDAPVQASDINLGVQSSGAKTGQVPAAEMAQVVQSEAELAGAKEKSVLAEQTKAAADRKKQEALGGDAAKKATAGFALVDKMKTNLYNLNDAMNALESGAQSGPISQYFPTVRAATVQLLNAQNRLGLDVIGAVTFGALSKGELDLALQTAIPTNLPEAELKAWLKKKVSAQTKLMGYIEEQSIFLSQDGNTEADWAEQRKADPRLEGGGGDDDPLGLRQ